MFIVILGGVLLGMWVLSAITVAAPRNRIEGRCIIGTTMHHHRRVQITPYGLQIRGGQDINPISESIDAIGRMGKSLIDDVRALGRVWRMEPIGMQPPVARQPRMLQGETGNTAYSENVNKGGGGRRQDGQANHDGGTGGTRLQGLDQNQENLDLRFAPGGVFW